MGINYIAGLRRFAENDPEITLRHESPFPVNRPVTVQPDATTDGMDPAARSGPAPMNAGPGFEDNLASVATDPLLQAPIAPGGPVPFIPGPDVNTTTLHPA